MKFCPSCEDTLPRDDFYRNRSKKDGLSGYCKVCQDAAHSETLLRHPRSPEYIERNRERSRARNALRK